MVDALPGGRLAAAVKVDVEPAGPAGGKLVCAALEQVYIIIEEKNT